MERIALDILGELPVTEDGKNIFWLYRIISRNGQIVLPNKEARTCMKILVNEVVSRFGVPN